jgi:hypothetical protein
MGPMGFMVLTMVVAVVVRACAPKARNMFELSVAPWECVCEPTRAQARGVAVRVGVGPCWQGAGLVLGDITLCVEFAW